MKQKAKGYAQDAVYEDWQKASKNVNKAADVLHLFIDNIKIIASGCFLQQRP